MVEFGDKIHPDTFSSYKDEQIKMENKYGMNAYRVPRVEYTRGKKRWNWDKICPDNKVMKSHDTKITQSIMEQQDLDIDSEDLMIWVNETMPEKDRGYLFSYEENRISDDWIVRGVQHDNIDNFINDAKCWFRNLPWKRKLKRMFKDTYLAYRIRLWAAKKGSWPEEIIGKEPEYTHDKELVEEWTRTIKEPFTPALEEYRIWWNENKNKYDNKQKEYGEKVYTKAQQLYNTLRKSTLKQKDLFNLYEYPTHKIWPLSAIDPPKTTLEWDTLNEWIYEVKGNLMWLQSDDENGKCMTWNEYADGNIKNYRIWKETAWPIVDQ